MNANPQNVVVEWTMPPCESSAAAIERRTRAEACQIAIDAVLVHHRCSLGVSVVRRGSEFLLRLEIVPKD